jgi:hypothetical protein
MSRAPAPRRADWFLRALCLALFVGLAVGLLLGVRLVLADATPSAPAPSGERA